MPEEKQTDDIEKVLSDLKSIERRGSTPQLFMPSAHQ